MKWTRPLCLILVLGLTFCGWMLLPEPMHVAAAPPGSFDFSLADLVISLFGPGMPVLAFGLIACWSAAGLGSIGSVARFLMGREREGDLVAAHHGMAAAARAMVQGGLTLGLLGTAAMYFLIGEALQNHDYASPADLAYLISFSLVAPLMALGVGRLILGVGADAAAMRAGLSTPRTFGSRDDLLLLLFILPPVLTFGSALWPMPTVQ